MADRTDSFLSQMPSRPIYKREPLPGQSVNSNDPADSPAMRSLPRDSYVAARTRQIKIDQEDAASLEIANRRRQAQDSQRRSGRTISPDWKPSTTPSTTPGWKKAESEASVHPVAAALEAEHQKNGITDPSKRVQQFSLMYGHVTGTHAIEAQKKHAELLRSTLNSIQEANTRAGDSRPASIHNTAIRPSEHAIWKSAEVKMRNSADGGLDLAESNRRQEEVRAKKVQETKAELSGIYAQHADANPTLHPAHVGDLVRHTLVKKIGAMNVTGIHDSAIQELNKDLQTKSVDEMTASGKMDKSHPRYAAISAAVGTRPAARMVPTSRDDEVEPDKGPEYEEPAAATKRAPIPREERVTKKQMAAHAQKLVFQHWVGSNPRPADMDHRDHFAAFQKTSESKNPMLYLKYKMGLPDPEGHVKSSILASRTPEAPEASAPREPRTLPKLSTIPDIKGRRAKVQAFQQSPLTAARPGDAVTKAARKAAFEGGAGAR